MNNNDIPIKEIVGLAKELIIVPSVSGDIESAVRVLELAKARLEGHPFTTFVSESVPSLLYSNKSSEDKHFKVILNAHLDVVPGTKEQFLPQVKDGKLYGRGAYDMKAATAAKIILFNELADKLPYPLGLQLTTDEELGGIHCTAYQIGKGIRGDFIITGECGSNFKIIHEAKGMLHLKLIANGKASHSAYPWKGRNAIMQIYDAIKAVHQRYPELQEEAYQTTANVTYIQTTNSSRHTVTPNYCEALIDVRYVASEKDAVLSTLHAVMPEGVESEIVLHTTPHATARDNPYIKQLQRISADVLKQDIIVTKQHATSDARHYSAVQCDGVEFGPIGSGQHDTQEFVEIQSLADYYHILRTFLLELE